MEGVLRFTIDVDCSTLFSSKCSYFIFGYFKISKISKKVMAAEHIFLMEIDTLFLHYIPNDFILHTICLDDIISKEKNGNM